MSLLYQVARNILFLFYPIFIYFGLKYFEARYVGLITCILIGLKFVSAKKRFKVSNIKLLIPAAIFCLVFFLLSLILNHPIFVKIYPVFVNLFLFLLFGFSLYKPPSMIERFARVTQPDLSPKAILYTRNVTLVWICFFALNGLISLYTVFETSLEMWTVYNGGISYILMGILFILEYVARIFVFKGEKA